MNKYVGEYVNKDLEIVEFEWVDEMTLEQKINFISEVTDVCVVNGHYIDLMFDYAVGIALINALTNIDVKDLTLSEVEGLVDDTVVVEILKEGLGTVAYNELIESVEKDLMFKGVVRNDVNSSIAKLIDTINNKIATSDINELIDKAKNLSAENIVSEYIGSNRVEDIIDITKATKTAKITKATKTTKAKTTKKAENK